MRTLITPWLSEARPSSRRKPKIPSIIIPRTSIDINHAIKHDDIVPTVQPTSTTASTGSSPLQESGEDSSAPDILALAELFATLKRTVSHLYATFDELDGQTKKLASFAPIEIARLMLERQISRHEKSMQEVECVLKNAVCESVVETLKAQLAETISDLVAKEVRSRVQQELSKQIPERLRHVQGHAREILEIQDVLRNSEGRCHNASLPSPCMATEPLRPLLRPLPSALQSPAYILKRPFTETRSGVASPMTSFSAVVTPAPAVRPGGSKQVFEFVSSLNSSTHSPLFPCDMKYLFGLGPGAAKHLLIDYGLDTTREVRSPKLDHTEASTNTFTGLSTPEASPALDRITTREEDISNFMNPIGLPFLMIPIPKPKMGPQLSIVIPECSQLG